MTFQLAFPEGWQTANTKQAVQGLSPEQDALVALTLAEGSTPAAALRSFLAGEGMAGGAVSERRLNGLPAAASDFRYSSQDGTLEGRAVFVSHGGGILRILGYAPASVWPSRRAVVTESLESIQPLTDPSLLNVEPERLQILTVQRSRDLESLVAQEGVSGRIDQVRLLNRLHGNPDLAVGRILKLPLGGTCRGEADRKPR